MISAIRRLLRNAYEFVMTLIGMREYHQPEKDEK